MKYLSILTFIVLSAFNTLAQDLDLIEKQSILEKRILSNSAIREHQIEEFAGYLTDDIAITTGNGTLIAGKDSLVRYVKILFEQNEDLFFVRESRTISLNPTHDRAWEQGVWTGFRPQTPGWKNIGGNYAAMWVKIEGIWKIRSELFVTLY